MITESNAAFLRRTRSYSTTTIMLRRDPTAIPLRDTDVQEVREMLAQKVKEQQDASGAAPPDTSQPASGPHVEPEEAQKRREAMTREERIGIQQ